MVVTDGERKVLAIERRDLPNAWQLPQGGLEAGEEPEEAALRELREETGLAPSEVELIRSLPGWLAYELPTEYRSEKTGRGQVQKWFLFRIRKGGSPDEWFSSPEARRVSWTTLSELVERAVAFRQPGYRQLAAALEPMLEKMDSVPGVGMKNSEQSHRPRAVAKEADAPAAEDLSDRSS